MERVQLIKSSIQGILIYSFIFISDLHLSYINWICGLVILFGVIFILGRLVGLLGITSAPLLMLEVW
jgi:hypothetical protein